MVIIASLVFLFTNGFNVGHWPDLKTGSTGYLSVL